MVAAKTKVASRSSRPTVPVEGGLAVIGAGFGRTGTSSLQEALEILGYGPCYHMREVFKDQEGLVKWDRVGRGEGTPDLWDDIFFGYKATVDLPGATYYKELLEHYPNAKVILTVRDEESWATSVMETICPAPPLWRFLYRITGTSSPKFNRMGLNTIWKPFCGGLRQARDREALIAAFRTHNAKVKEVVPPEKLLIFNVKDGWSDLCTFLGEPVPSVPFPKLWNSAAFKVMIVTRKKKTIRRLAVGGCAVIALVASIGLLSRKRIK